MGRLTTNLETDSPKYDIKVLDETWNSRLLHLARASPVRTRQLGIHFDRSPDIFTIPRLTSFKYRCIGFFKDKNLVGFAMATYQKRYVDGTVSDVLYLGNIHITQRGLGKPFLEKLYQRFMDIVPTGTDVSYLYAYIMGNNIPAMKLLKAGHLQAEVIGKITMTTIFLVIPKSLSSRLTVRRAEQEDIDTIVRLLQKEHQNRFLAPAINKGIFLKNLRQRPNFSLNNYLVAIKEGEIAGVCSAWDMTPFKKNRILYYGNKLAVSRLLYNGVARLFGSPRLPKPGEAFRDITIAEYAVRDRDPEILNALLRFLYRHYRDKGYQSIIVGNSEKDPLLRATDGFLKKEVTSNVILASHLPDLLKQHEVSPLLYADAIQI